MKCILSIIFLILICGCSNYKMVKLPEPVRDNITERINVYLIRPTVTDDSEFKEVFGIDQEAEIDVESFRVLLVDWKRGIYKDKDFAGGFIIPIYDYENIYRQENQYIPNNPWEEYLSENTDNYIRGMNSFATKEAGILYDLCQGYDYSKIDISDRTGASFYFEGASEEEIINYIKQIPLSIRMFDIDYKHYTLGYCKHTYLINDVNLFIENENGELIKK